mgnify:FL=1
MKIRSLKINTSGFDAQVAFYSEVIGLQLISKKEHEAVFELGASKLILKRSKDFQPYHFAINIPCNMEQEALIWLKNRVTILKDGDSEIQNFESWNARAIYFYDKDGNIVELIARRNLRNEYQGKFDRNCLLEISEIGIATDNIKSVYSSLTKIVTLKKYDGGWERFCALGDENGLFICINKRLKNWCPTDDKAYSAPFEIEFQEKGKGYKLGFKNEQIMAINEY